MQGATRATRHDVGRRESDVSAAVSPPAVQPTSAFPYPGVDAGRGSSQRGASVAAAADDDGLDYIMAALEELEEQVWVGEIGRASCRERV